MLQSVKSNVQNDAITMLASVFELEIYAHQDNFEKAYELFEVKCRLSLF